MNGKPFIIELNDLGGGLNEGEADSIADREASVLENLYPANRTSLWSREGRVAIASAYAETINAIARYNPSFTEDEYTIIGAATSVGRLVGAAIQALATGDFQHYRDLLITWGMHLNRGCMRNLTGTGTFQALHPLYRIWYLNEALFDSYLWN